MAPLLGFRAFAKINPVLEVLGKRPDGYHELSLLFQTIGLYDTLTFEKAPEGIHLEIPGAPVGLSPGDDNLVFKAAKLFFQKHAPVGGARIHLTKKIPLAAGLGGGSSDAAAALRGLDALFQTKLGPEALQSMAAALGSDVPFFLKGGTALGTGRGEIITPLPPLPEMNLVLVKPQQGLSTPAVYQSGKAQLSAGEYTRKFQSLSPEGPLPALAGNLFNGLEPAALFLMPEVGEIKRRLLEAGAIGALVSGSGPTVFGIARTPAEAEAIAQQMEGGGRMVWVTKTVSAPPFETNPLAP